MVITTPLSLGESLSARSDYAVDWTKWLKGDTIATSTWNIPTGLTKITDSHDEKIATIWLKARA